MKGLTLREFVDPVRRTKAPNTRGEKTSITVLTSVVITVLQPDMLESSRKGVEPLFHLRAGPTQVCSVVVTHQEDREE